MLDLRLNFNITLRYQQIQLKKLSVKRKKNKKLLLVNFTELAVVHVQQYLYLKYFVFQFSKKKFIHVLL